MEDKELKRITAKLRQIEKMLDQALELSSNDKVVDRLISVKEAAQMLNISENKLRNEIRSGNIKAFKTKRAYKLSYVDVLKRVGFDFNQKKQNT